LERFLEAGAEQGLDFPSCQGKDLLDTGAEDRLVLTDGRDHLEHLEELTLDAVECHATRRGGSPVL
jgi:hypothetical protein